MRGTSLTAVIIYNHKLDPRIDLKLFNERQENIPGFFVIRDTDIRGDSSPVVLLI
jgi:hypothetical protein